MSRVEIESVKAFRGRVHELLLKAAQVKPKKQIEPPLTEADLGDSIWHIKGQGDATDMKEQTQLLQYAAVETAFREKFYELLVSVSMFLHIMAYADVPTGYDVD
jgi:THO complex subunit 1